MNIEFKLRALSCGTGTSYVMVQEYVTAYRLYTNKMSSAGYPMPPHQLLQIFADGLPNNAIFANLRQSIYISLNEPDDLLLTPMEDIYSCTKIIDDTSQRLRLSRRTNMKPRQPNQSSATSLPVDQKSSKPVCGNCGGVHLTKNCFQAGGAMEGKHDEVLAMKSLKTPQAHVAVADDVYTGSGMDNNEFEITDLTTTRLAAMCITRPISAESISYSSYAMSTIIKPSNSESTLITPAFLTSSNITQNSVLDLACTQHIIRDRNLFWTYDPTGAKSVGTANCGTLETLAAGDVKLWLTIDNGDRPPIHINWTLRNCLHAPGCPINLISVGTLTDARMNVNFAPLRFPNDPQKLGHLAGKSFSAKVINKLSFLDCNFVYPSPDPTIEPICAFPVFPPTVLNPELWHHRLGHPGIDSTRDVLTKDMVTGVTWTGSFTRAHCIPCLIGKSPQASYSSNKHHADKICELIHIDTCGPYPVMTKKKEKYFLVILDDHSNYGACPLLVLKSGASIAWRKTKARWENLSGNRVKAVRIDNAKEFVEGKMREDLDIGIVRGNPGVFQLYPYPYP